MTAGDVVFIDPWCQSRQVFTPFLTQIGLFSGLSLSIVLFFYELSTFHSFLFSCISPFSVKLSLLFTHIYTRKLSFVLSFCDVPRNFSNYELFLCLTCPGTWCSAKHIMWCSLYYLSSVLVTSLETGSPLTFPPSPQMVPSYDRFRFTALQNVGDLLRYLWLSCRPSFSPHLNSSLRSLYLIFQRPSLTLHSI